MRLYRDNLIIRVLGTILGMAFLAMGLYSLLGVGDGISEFQKDRSLAFGIFATISGVAAVFGSWAEQNVKGIWCAHPPRWLWRRRGPQSD